MSLYNAASTSNFREYANNVRFADAFTHTISIWVNPTSAAPAAQQIWVARGDGTIAGDWTCGTPASGTFQVSRASITTSSGLQSVADTIQWQVRTWFHYCQTFDGTILRLYVNGRQRASSTPAGTFTQTTTGAIRLWMRTGLQNPGDQYVEQFGLWRRAFTAEEVDWLARGNDFTKIARNDAIILDPLRDPRQRELVAGLGVNTGAIVIREAAPIFPRRPDVRLARPLAMQSRRFKTFLLRPAAPVTTQTYWAHPASM